MDLQYFIGEALFSKVLFAISGAGVLILLLLTLFTIFYHKFYYKKVLLKRYDSNYKPKCSVILPCKGLPANFERNIESFVNIEYDNYEVIYTVESEVDLATQPIRDLVAKHDHASLVVAGYSKQCSQKNYNMLEAVKKTDNPDVYIFADSDIELSKTWIDDLVRPLSHDKVTITSGFRWLYSKNGKLGEIANVYQNIIIYVLFTFASFTQNIGLWGGSMAIRKKDFEDLGVEEFWGNTVVDDMSLSALIMKKKKIAVMSSDCLIPTDDALTTVKSSTDWFVRQMMFMKGYQKLQWYSAILLSSFMLMHIIWLPVSLIISQLTDYSFAFLAGYSSLLLLSGIAVTYLLYPFMGRVPFLIRSIIFQPISLFTIVWGILRTLFSNTVLWSGIEYKLDRQGKVTSVKR